MESGWEICQGAYEAIHTLCEDLQSPTIVEFGSGIGTERLAPLGVVFSIEHDSNWILDYDGVQYIHAPLVEIEPIPSFDHNQWYDADIVFEMLPDSFDIILVDGPPGSIGRSGLLLHLDRFPKDCIWLIDDTLRPDEGRLSDHIAVSGSMYQYRFWNFSILSTKPIDVERLEKIRAGSLSALSRESVERIRLFYPAFRVQEAFQ